MDLGQSNLACSTPEIHPTSISFYIMIFVSSLLLYKTSLKTNNFFNDTAINISHFAKYTHAYLIKTITNLLAFLLQEKD